MNAKGCAVSNKEQISIKMEPELRHVLAHMSYAIEALAKGNLGEAQYEIESIKGLVFWDNDEAMAADAEALFGGGEEDGGTNKELQGEELQKEGQGGTKKRLPQVQRQT